MNIISRDLNLLILFKYLYETQNLSAAAEHMGLSQPALSHKLNKLRSEFEDPLFVRAARGLSPTPKAHELAGEVIALVAQLERFYQFSDGGDFLQKEAVIHLYSTDYIEQILLPDLLPRMAEQAPKVKIITHNTRGALPVKELETGRCDIAISGFYKDLPNSLYQQSLPRGTFCSLSQQI